MDTAKIFYSVLATIQEALCVAVNHTIHDYTTYEVEHKGQRLGRLCTYGSSEIICYDTPLMYEVIGLVGVRKYLQITSVLCFEHESPNGKRRCLYCLENIYYLSRHCGCCQLLAATMKRTDDRAIFWLACAPYVGLHKELVKYTAYLMSRLVTEKNTL